jgi:hypothetical protein
MLEIFALANPDATAHSRGLIRGNATVPVAIVESASGTGKPVLLAEIDGETVDRVEYSTALSKWTKGFEKEFISLVKNAALGRLDQRGSERLDHLRQARRQFKNPRTSEEIIAEFKQRRATSELLAALQRHAKLHKAENNPWDSAEENIHGR